MDWQDIILLIVGLLLGYYVSTNWLFTGNIA